MTDIFEQEVQDQEEAPQIDPDKDYFSELVGDGKKYRDERALARAAAEKEAHIQRLERENAEYREKVQHSKTVEEIMDQLRSDRQAHRQEEDNQVSENGSEKVADNSGANLKPDDIEELLERKLQERTTQEQRARNSQWVRQQLEQKYGPGYQDHLLKMGQSLEMSREDLAEMAASRPRAFMQLVNAPRGSDAPTSAPPNTSVNTSATPSGPAGKTYSYYQKMKRENPAVYESARIQAEMHQEAIKQGAAFFD